MPFFDRVPDPPKEELNRSPRRWLAWFAIPLATGFACLAYAGRRNGGFDNAWIAFYVWSGILAGEVCILFSRPQRRGLKWALVALYPFVMFTAFAVIGAAVDGIARLF